MKPATLLTRFSLLVALILAVALIPGACESLTSDSGTTATKAQTTTTVPAVTSTTLAGVFMPQLVGMEENAAKALLDGLGLAYQIKSVPTLSSSKRGQVSAQDVDEGALLALGTKVRVSVYRTGVEVPSLSGCPDYDAQGWVESLGLKISITYDPPKASIPPTLFSVDSQSPASGKVVLKGSTVKVTCRPEL
jgi:beta-lactam-binding protein with PASTA domain